MYVGENVQGRHIDYCSFRAGQFLFMSAKKSETTFVSAGTLHYIHMSGEFFSLQQDAVSVGVKWTDAFDLRYSCTPGPSKLKLTTTEGEFLRCSASSEAWVRDDEGVVRAEVRRESQNEVASGGVRFVDNDLNPSRVFDGDGKARWWIHQFNTAQRCKGGYIYIIYSGVCNLRDVYMGTSLAHAGLFRS